MSSRRLGGGALLGLGILLVHPWFSSADDDHDIAARYNAVHWLVADAFASRIGPSFTAQDLRAASTSILQLDLSGPRLFGAGRAQNVLIVVMEGVTGFQHPDIRQAMGVSASEFAMTRLQAATKPGMLVPDFVAHNHQTIRGLYSILCGDISKLSQTTPKATELMNAPQRAKDCLPAQMAKNGWSTHYLQGAGLSFMGKDRFMPLIGFQHVHGREWFDGPPYVPFAWGVDDRTFFEGARSYIRQLWAEETPWMLTLLTVGTHQPYAVPDDLAEQYESRKAAAVAYLDQAIADFIEGLRQDGVLDDTLVILTSDESHGAELADWVSSWGLGIVLAPEQSLLPRLKTGVYGLMDITASVLDYLGLKVLPTLAGRSLFRDYAEPREIASYTAGKLRWLAKTGVRYECTVHDGCRACAARSLLGDLPEGCEANAAVPDAQVLALAARLDHSVREPDTQYVMRFANGERRKLPERVLGEWADNLIGAQYLDFPAGSRASVSIHLKVVSTSHAGARLWLTLRQQDEELSGIAAPTFPLLFATDESSVSFDIDNPEARSAFSFHLLGEGDAEIEILDFTVSVGVRS